MANHVSALKRARQTETRTAVNRAASSKLRGELRKMREALVAGDKKAAAATYSAVASVIDKAAAKGVLHKNTASRYKSRLGKRLNKIGAAK